MGGIRPVYVGLIGLILAVSGVALWVVGDRASAYVPLPIASTRVFWAPAMWVLGIIVMLSTALAQTLRLKNYLMWIVLLVAGYLAVFVVLGTLTHIIMG